MKTHQRSKLECAGGSNPAHRKENLTMFPWKYKLSTCQERVRKLTKEEEASASYLRGGQKLYF